MDSKLKTLTLCRRAGLTAEDIHKTLTAALEQTARKEHWTPRALAMAKRDWEKFISQVYGEGGNNENA
jgi:hypothetical protein